MRCRRATPAALAAIVGLLASGGCAGADPAAARARIEAAYRTPVNEGRAGCLADAIVKRADEHGVEIGSLADRIADTSGDTPHFDAEQASVIADALTDCPLAPSDAATTSSAPDDSTAPDVTPPGSGVTSEPAG